MHLFLNFIFYFFPICLNSQITKRTPTTTQASAPKDIIRNQKLPQPVPQPPVPIIFIMP